MSDENKNNESTAGASSNEAPKEAPAGSEHPESVASQLKHSAEQLKTAAEAKARELTAAAGVKAKEFAAVAEAKAKEYAAAAGTKAKEFRATAEAKAEDLKGQAGKAWGDASEKAKSLRSDGEGYVRQNPIGAVVGALVAGFFLGLLFRKN